MLSVFDVAERCGQGVHDVARHEALHSLGAHCQVSGKSVEIHTQHAGLLMLVAPRQKSSDDAREHVAASGSSHSGVARGVERHGAVGHAQHRVVSFYYNVRL